MVSAGANGGADVVCIEEIKYQVRRTEGYIEPRTGDFISITPFLYNIHSPNTIISHADMVRSVAINSDKQ